MAPTWVPRWNNISGHRLRLHPDDIYAYGLSRGAITERWLNSVTKALNGPKTTEFEGLSFVVADEKKKDLILLRDFISELGEKLIGSELMEKYGNWPAFSKIYDYDRPLYHHLHIKEELAQRIGMHGKPEAYFFPLQYNQTPGQFPVSYFGFDPSTDQESIKECLRCFTSRDNRITDYSRAFRLQPDTGWYTPAGVIHAPGTLATYEPQWASDVATIMENISMGEVTPYANLVQNQPDDEKGDVDKLIEQIDWEESTRPDYKQKYFRRPLPLPSNNEILTQQWICYGNDWIGGKEIILAPGQSAKVKDQACYGAIVIQGFGRFGNFACETPGLLRFGQLSGDEFFVSESAAREGVSLHNESRHEPLVILQNFANNNPEVPQRW